VILQIHKSEKSQPLHPTLTTVGYGDIYPKTVCGKIFTFLVLMFGLGIVAVPTAIFVSALTEAKKMIKSKD